MAEGQIVASGTVAELMESITHNHTVRFLINGKAEDMTAVLQSRFDGVEVKAESENSLVMVSERRIPLFPVIEIFHEQGIEVYEGREIRPSLEDVFVKLTGIESSVLKKEKEKEEDDE